MLSLKSKIKKAIKGTLRAWFAPKIRTSDFQRGLQALQVPKDKPVLVHSSLSAFGFVPGGPKTLIDGVQNYLGPSATIVLPTHTWSFVSRGLKTFDVRVTPSCVGAVTEWFRQQPGVIRSLHPTHSIAAIGRGADELCSGHDQCDTPCGSASPYHKLLTSNGTILLLGAPLDSNTCYHTLEALAGVDYLLQKQPTHFDITDAHGRSFSRAFQLHQSGIRRDLGSLYRNLQESGGMSVSQVGGAKVTAINGQVLLKVGMDLLESKPLALLDT
jgi:aminoglycoside 3-N-acetyltransferase